MPNAEILVLRPDGSECIAGEPGELVHRGAFVTLGYWNNPERTAERFKPVPSQFPGAHSHDIAVWSGDMVVRDEVGFLYFVGRNGDLIKVSGYRVSPTGIEEAVLSTPLVQAAVAVGVPHPTLGQAIVVFAVSGNAEFDAGELIAACKSRLPSYMLPGVVVQVQELPRNMKGKIDRKSLAAQYYDYFAPKDVLHAQQPTQG